MRSFRRKMIMLILLFVEAYNRMFHKILIINSTETLKKVISERKSISRYGDGEFNILLKDNLIFQEYNENLKKRMMEVLVNRDNNTNCLVCIPYAMRSVKGLTAKSRLFWFEYFAQKRKSIEPFLADDLEYYDAQITRFYINRRNKNESAIILDLWRRIWDDKNILVVEGSKSRFGVNNNLFDNVKSIRRIICPSENAYEYYDEIYSSVLEIKDMDLCILALGPTATILAYDLSKKGIWAIDSGNMDMEYEWMLKGVTKQTAVAGKYTLEAKDGTIVSDCDDVEYKSQVIKSIGLFRD